MPSIEATSLKVSAEGEEFGGSSLGFFVEGSPAGEWGSPGRLRGAGEVVLGDRLKLGSWTFSEEDL